MSKVLITGSTGHLGFRTLVLLLQNTSHDIVAAVRSEKKAQFLSSHQSLKEFVPSRLSFIIVPDLLVSGAYDLAVNGVEYVVHIASPISDNSWTTEEQFQKNLIEPAVRGTLNMLEAVKTAPAVKRVVITSSVVAIIPFNEFMDHNNQRIYTPESRAPNPEGPFGAAFAAYGASKVKALNAAESWISREKPHFDVVHVMPSFIEGRDETVSSTQEFLSGGTNQLVMGVALGVKNPTTFPSTTVHLDDAAKVHVGALSPKIPGGSSWITTWNADDTLGGTTWQEATEAVSRLFPDAISAGKLTNDGVLATQYKKFDARETEKVFGFKHKSYEQQVKSVVGHYLELLKAEQAVA